MKIAHLAFLVAAGAVVASGAQAGSGPDLRRVGVLLANRLRPSIDEHVLSGKRLRVLPFVSKSGSESGWGRKIESAIYRRLSQMRLRAHLLAPTTSASEALDILRTGTNAVPYSSADYVITGEYSCDVGGRCQADALLQARDVRGKTNELSALNAACVEFREVGGVTSCDADANEGGADDGATERPRARPPIRVPTGPSTGGPRSSGNDLCYFNTDDLTLSRVRAEYKAGQYYLKFDVLSRRKEPVRLFLRRGIGHDEVGDGTVSSQAGRPAKQGSVSGWFRDGFGLRLPLGRPFGMREAFSTKAPTRSRTVTVDIDYFVAFELDNGVNVVLTRLHCEDVPVSAHETSSGE